MNKSFIIASAVLMMGATTCCNSKCGEFDTANDTAVCDSTKCEKRSATPEEIAAIRIPIDMYINASVEGDSRVAVRAFAEGATISHVEGDSLICLPIQALFDYYDTTGKQTASYEITECNVADDIAIVRIESKFGDIEYADMFTLVKDGDGWKIVSKVFHTK